jgi:hypothetical protein
LFKTFSNFITAWRQWQHFNRLPFDEGRLVVYSEGAHDWPHMGPMLIELLKIGTTEQIAYLSSARTDPGLSFDHPRFSAYYIGSESVRTLCFKLMHCKVALMTLPDLDAYHLKRSVKHPVHYAYCFHSINSMHAVYREHAFEAYTSMFCVGPHHVAELQREEQLKGLEPRRLIAHGSVKLDRLIADYAPFRGPPRNPVPIVLIAPSWGVGSIAEAPGLLRRAIAAIVVAGWQCRLRLHPMTVRHRPALLTELRDEFAPAVAADTFRLETDLNDNRSLMEADVMVSDWSGAATEFAFALERPVLFIDTEQKVNNPGWVAYGLPCLEAEIRGEIGHVLAPDDIQQLTAALADLMDRAGTLQQSIVKARTNHIYNVGTSAEAGAHALLSLIRA